MLSLYQGLNRGPSDPEADDIPVCHCASFPSTLQERVIYKSSNTTSRLAKHICQPQV